MNVLFLGSLYPKEREREINENILMNYQFAANNLQWALIEGLSHYYEKLSIITAPVIGSYPNGYKKMYFKGGDFQNNYLSDTNNRSVSFFNLPFINLLSKYFSVKREVYEWSKSVSDSDKQIIIYSPHTPFLKAAVKAKRKFKNIKITLVVPDLPEYMSENNNPVYKMLKKIDVKVLNRDLKKVDNFVLLSSYMKKPLNVGNRKWALVEGIFQGIPNKSPLEKKNKKTKVVLYTGALTKKDGIFELIEAFKGINDSNYQLWLRGDGPILSEVKEIIKGDDRIKLIGRLSRSELLNLQMKATVLVNPTPVDNESAKYFFPSKMMDYLASGTPTITSKLPGIPKEYFRYCFTTENENADGLRNKIQEVCEMPEEELEKIGNEAKKFILNKKNPIKQVEKIYQILKT